jgi:DNA-binding NarL/FixJ family response regulator
MLDSGALGYLLKNADQDVLVQAIRTVHEGRQFIDPALKEQLLQDMLAVRKKQAAVPALTQREQEVLQLIGNNHTSQEIADKLFLSKHTIDHYRISLLVKFEVKNASGLIKKAIDLGLIK